MWAKSKQYVGLAKTIRGSLSQPLKLALPSVGPAPSSTSGPNESGRCGPTAVGRRHPRGARSRSLLRRCQASVAPQPPLALRVTMRPSPSHGSAVCGPTSARQAPSRRVVGRLAGHDPRVREAQAQARRGPGPRELGAAGATVELAARQWKGAHRGSEAGMKEGDES